MEPNEKYQCKRNGKTYELEVITPDNMGYTVTVYEEGNAGALRMYQVHYLGNSLYQKASEKSGVEALKELAKHDIEKGWL